MRSRMGAPPAAPAGAQDGPHGGPEGGTHGDPAAGPVRAEPARARGPWEAALQLVDPDDAVTVLAFAEAAEARRPGRTGRSRMGGVAALRNCVGSGRPGPRPGAILVTCPDCPLRQ